MRNNEKGITLVALVVTIIVLLILAGITISVALNNGGILGRAEKAKEETEIAAIKDYISLALLNIRTEYYAGGTLTFSEAGGAEALATDILKKEIPAGYTVAGNIKVAKADGAISLDGLTITNDTSKNTYLVEKLSPLTVTKQKK